MEDLALSILYVLLHRDVYLELDTGLYFHCLEQLCVRHLDSTRRCCPQSGLWLPYRSLSHMSLLIPGLDVIPLTIDWSQVSGFLLSPLMTPFWAIGNVFVGFVFWIWFITPILHFTNVWYGKYMPISTSISYDNTGKRYKVLRVLDQNFRFDLTKYKAYSPLFLGTTFALAYGLSFATITAVLVHTYLFYGDEIWRQFKESLHQEDDIHMKLMKAYRQAPDWWYVALGLVMFGISVGVCEGWDTQMV